ncbi:hypothetical protein ACT3RU_17525 [Halomonas sp. TP35]
MSRITIWLLAGLLVATGLLGWQAWERWDAVAYLTDDYSAITGWDALRAAWPVWAVVGGIMAIVGTTLGAIAGENTRTHASEARAVNAERERDEARQTAENALTDAQAAVSAERAELVYQQQQAREEIAAARGALVAAKRESDRLHERVAQQAADLADYQLRLGRSISATHRRKRRIERLEADLAALRGEILR